MTSKDGTGREAAEEALAAILRQHPSRRDELIPALQDVQDALGYIPPWAIPEIAARLGVAESEAYGVITFYTQFYLTRQGRHRIKVCQGTACHVRGGDQILQVLSRKLGIKAGETTPDYQFSLERVACFGSCALGPVLVVDGRVHGRVTPEGATQILEQVE